VVDQQPHLSGGSLKLRGWKLRFPQCGPGDRERVDGVRLAVAAGGVAGVGHQLGRHAHDPLAGAEQVALEPARQVPAVLHGPQPLLPELLSPAQQPEMVLAGGAGRALAELTAELVDRDDGVGALVRIDAQDHHGLVSLRSGMTPTGRRAPLSRGDATLLSSHAGRSTCPAGRTRGPSHRRHQVVERASRTALNAHTDASGV
jgi:hypothetical protein